MPPQELRQAKQELAKVQADLVSVPAGSNYDRAPELRATEQELKDKVAELERQWQDERAKASTVVNEDEIAHIVYSWTGIPVSRLVEGESVKLMEMENVLHGRLIGQDDAVVAVSKAVRRTRSGLKDPKRPMGSFIFLGPTGVGKTELARALAAFLFETEDALIRIDMSEYMERFAVSRLVGAPPGYVGYDEGGQLTEAVRRRPYSVILLDEIEKAHPEVFNILLQVMEDGRLTDSQGRVVDFKNSIVIMTSNIGAQSIQSGAPMGFRDMPSDVDTEKNYESMKNRITEEMKRTFRPEFLNRVDDVIVFHQLTKSEILQIVDLMLDRVRQQMSSQGMDLVISQEVRELLASEGFDPQYGARPLRRAVQRLIEDPLSEEMLLGRFTPGDTVRAELEDNKIFFTKSADLKSLPVESQPT
jgi:ATP-dependent Clp protease ATP-binding subunit ClpC